MKVIGLCGGTGSGKGYVSKIFGEFDIPSIDTDALYHELISHKSLCSSELVDAFGENILNSDGTISRKQLSTVVFSDKSGKKIKLLNRISHKHILAECRNIIKSYENEGKSAVIVDAPLLFESGFNSECDTVIAVISNPDLRIKRVMERDNISRQRVIERILNQVSDEYLIANSDYVIYNNSDYNAVYVQAEKIIKDINL